MILAHKYLEKDGRTMYTRSGDQSGVRTRQVPGIQGLVTRNARTDTQKHSFAVRAVEGWNGLPDSVNEVKPDSI